MPGDLRLHDHAACSRAEAAPRCLHRDRDDYLQRAGATRSSACPEQSADPLTCGEASSARLHRRPCDRQPERLSGAHDLRRRQPAQRDPVVLRWTGAEASGESGFTIVEVMVAAMVLTLGAMATFGVLSSATKNAQRAKASQVALDRAQQEIELLRSLEQRGTGADRRPPHSSQPAEPRLPGHAQRHLRADPGAAGRLPQLVVNGGASTAAGSSKAARSIPARPVHQRRRHRPGLPLRRLAQRRQLPGSALPRQPGLQADRRRREARQPGNETAERGYVEVAVGLRRPTDSAENDPMPGAGGEVVTAQQFFLSDTPCSASGAPRAKTSSATICCTTRSGPAPAGLQTGTDPGRSRRAAARQPAGPGLLEDPTTRRSTTTPTTSIWSRRRTPTGRADPPRRHQRLQLHADRDHQPRVAGAPLGDRPDGGRTSD